MPDGTPNIKGIKPIPKESTRSSWMMEWWSSKKAEDMLTESLTKSGVSAQDARPQAVNYLAERRRKVQDTDFYEGGTSGFGESLPEDENTKRGAILINPNQLTTKFAGTPYEKMLAPNALVDHELAHRGVGQKNQGLPAADVKTLSDNEYNLNAGDRGANEQEEIYSRSHVFRRAAADAGIYKPDSESFTGEHYDAMLKKYGTGKAGVNAKDRETDNIQQFLRNTSRESAIGILNTVAKADDPAKAWGANFA